MAIDYSGLFKPASDIRADRLRSLQERNLAVQGMGGSMSGLLGQVAAGSGGMLAEATAGIFGLKTQAERDAEEKQLAVNSVKAQPGTPEYFEELSAKLSNIDPAASLAFKDKAIALQQQSTENDFRKQQLAMQKEGIDLQREGLKLQGITARIAQGKFDDETKRRKAYEGLAYGLTSDPAGLKAIGFEDDFIQSLADGDASMAVPIIADRLEDFADYSKTVAASGADTAAIKDYKYYNSLPPEDKADFIAMKRGGSKVDAGDKWIIYDALGNPVSEVKKQLAPEQQPEYKGEVKTAETSATLNAEFVASAPKVLSQSRAMLDTIDKLMGSIPKLSWYDKSVLFGSTSFPDDSPLWRAATESAGQAKGLYDQMLNQSFLQAYESLKGAGQITEIEGKMATQAINVLQNRTLYTPETAMNAMKELREVIASGMSRTESRLSEGGAQAQPGDVKTLVFDPSTGEFK